jgi:hypothetical protein
LDHGGSHSATTKEGMSIDPNGQPSGTTTSGDEGMLIDPHG